MDNLIEYLLQNRFDKQLIKITKKLKDKTIVIYGAGKLFETIIKHYDLSNLNIIGISDRKYTDVDEGSEDLGYKIIPYYKLTDYHPDCILVAAKNFIPVIKQLKEFILNIPIVPLVNTGVINKIRSYFNQNRFNCNNTFVLIKQNGKKIYNPKIKNLHVSFSGDNNYIEIHEPFSIKNKVNIYCECNSNLIINENNRYSSATIYMWHDNTLTIGKNVTVESVKFLMKNCSNRKITIGDDCMFSYDIIIRATDAHTIYDKDTRKIINPAEDVTIGNHVWINARAMILKGSHIPSYCVIGACALVNKEFSEENCIIAGVPAKIVKRNINWDRRPENRFD